MSGNVERRPKPARCFDFRGVTFFIPFFIASLQCAPRCSAPLRACFASVRAGKSRSIRTSRTMAHARKPGVCSDDEFDAFLAANMREAIVVVDARNPDFGVEADDEQFGGPDGSAPIADCGTTKRPNAVNAAFDRVAKALPIELVEAKTKGDLATPIVTHCGGGGRGQKAKEFLEANGYTNVVNGGGPAVKELWDKFGSL